jgi:hypothetical protein
MAAQEHNRGGCRPDHGNSLDRDQRNQSIAIAETSRSRSPKTVHRDQWSDRCRADPEQIRGDQRVPAEKTSTVRTEEARNLHLSRAETSICPRGFCSWSYKPMATMAHDRGRRAHRWSPDRHEARPGTGTRWCQCRYIVCCDVLRDIERPRPDRDHVSTTGTDANRWSQ